MGKITLFLFTLLLAISAKGDVNPIGDFHMVLDGKIYRGARPGDQGLQGGDDIGPLSNPGESKADILEERAAAIADGIQFINVPLSSLNPDFDDQDQKIGQILNLISDPANQPVFFHCFHGEDRTGVVAALYRVIYQGCTEAQAHAEMIRDGHSKKLFWIDRYLADSTQKFPPSSLSLLSSCPL
jgi:tyrosine-protein phosphatase SIW14